MPHHTKSRVENLAPSKTKSIDQEPLVGSARYALERKVLSRVKKTPRFLLHELFDFFQGKADCFPSNSTIAQVSGISPRNVQYLLRQLETLEVVKSIEDHKIPSQRRIVLLEHPNTLKVMRELGALPEWMARLAFPIGEPDATTAPVGTQGRREMDAMPASESPKKRTNGTRVFKALRGMGSI